MSKKSSSLSFGPGASSLILIFVVLSMTVLGMLSLLSARNDFNLSVRSVHVLEAQYQLNQQAEEKRAEIDRILYESRQISDTDEAYYQMILAALPEGFTAEYSDSQPFLISFSVTDGSRTLLCRFAVNPLSQSDTRAYWWRHSLTAETGEEIWN